MLNQFFGTVFGEQKGWAYTATKEVQEDGRGAWIKKFFKFPEQKDEMIEFIIVSSADKEVYYSPALYKNDRSTQWGDDGKQIPNPIVREDFLGTNFVWADFDYGLPDDEKLENVPAPTMIIRSSANKKQHWYWNLTFFETNPDALEKITRTLTYHLGADLSGWDYQQVLRPPETIHHKTGLQVKIIKQQQSDSRVPLEAFVNIPDIPDYVWDVEIDETKYTNALKVIGIHKITESGMDLILKPSQPVGKRSSALTRVGYECAEAGMNNNEIYCVLKNCDSRWKKFAPRGEESQKKNLIGIIRYVRQKYPLDITGADSDDELPYFTFGEFSKMKYKVEWIVEGLIQKNGTPIITGLGGSFKTHMTFNLACHMVAGKKFLHWTFARPMTLCIVSNELAPAETMEELKKIVNTFTLEEQALIAKNLHVIPLGSRLALNKKKEQDKLLRKLEAFHPEGLFFDSLGQSIDTSPNSDETINDVFDFMKLRVNQYYDAFSWFIHHMRKEQIGNKKPKSPSDIYGSAYIFNNASLAINLWKETPSSTTVDVDYLKVRFAKPPPSFKMRRLEDVGFELVSNDYVDLGMGSNINGNAFDGLDV